MSKKSENLSDLNKKDRNKRRASPFINVVKGVFFVVRVTLVPVSYLSAPAAVHRYRVPGKFICIVVKIICLVFPTFLTLQDKHNIRTLSLNIKFICTRCETGLKSSLFCLFIKIVQINFIFTDNVRILYIYSHQTAITLTQNIGIHLAKVLDVKLFEE
jgi:hypothetical protein